MNIYDIVVKDNLGNDVSLKEYKGKVFLIVNTATGCGFTRQYDGLEKLYQKYKDHGFEILDFPCNQFLGQAPGSDQEIDSFCKLNYGTTFKRFSKIKVNGKDSDSLYEFLKSQIPGRITWNFTKFLIDRDGSVIDRFNPNIPPEKLENPIKSLL